MMDREKVKYSIERCISHVPDACRDCAYDAGHPYNECVEMMLNDALALLKEQKAVKPKSKVRHGANPQIQHFCGNCNSMLHGKPKYCSECGKGVLW